MAFCPSTYAKGLQLQRLGEQEGLEGLLCHTMFQTDLVEGLLLEGPPYEPRTCRLQVQQSLKVQPSLKVHHPGSLQGPRLEVVEVQEVLEILQVLDGSIEVAYEQSYELPSEVPPSCKVPARSL